MPQGGAPSLLFRRALPAVGVLALFLLSALLLAYAALRPPPPLTPPAPGAVLSDVTLVEPGGARADHRRLVVSGERIAAIEPARPDPGDPLRGVYALPGLNDLHVHFPPGALPGQTELFALLFLRYGVTAVRDAGDVDGTSTEPAWRGALEGRFPGPRVLRCGPFVDGEIPGQRPRWQNTRVVTTPEEARAAVEAIADAGNDCVKAYDELDAASLAALRETAAKRGLPVIGHVPWRVPFEEARLDDMQHLIGVPPQDAGRPPPFPHRLASWDRLDDARLDFVIAESLRLGIAHTPTLVARERLASGMRPGAYERLSGEADALLLPRFFRELLWNPAGGINSAGKLHDEADYAMVDRALAKALHAVARMHAAGVRLHSGSDVLNPFVVPGASLWRELRLFVAAGLTPEQALAISTRDSADALRVPALGRLEVGAPAELALFREDPTRDLAALDTLAGVVRGGRLYTREALDADFERRRRHFESPVYRSVMTFLVRRAIARNRPPED